MDSPLYVFQLLYVLQVLRKKAHEPEWRVRFVESGGLTWLVSLFNEGDLSGNAAQAGRYGSLCTSYLVDMLNLLFECEDVASQVKDALTPVFLSRVMERVRALALDPPRFAPPKTAEHEEPDWGSSSARQGTRIANCHYASGKHLLTFHTTGEHYQAACYCVDYNTTRRKQSLVAFLGDDASIAETPEGMEHHPNAVILSGPDFHQGQWVVWDVHGPGPFNVLIRCLEGPNWVFSSFNMDKSPNPDAPCSKFPTLIGIDNKTQGKWRGTYGAYGGILLGITDYRIPVRPDRPKDAPTFVDCNTGACEKYEWVNCLTSDMRAMQQVPNEDEFDYWSTSEEEEETEELAPLQDKAEAGLDQVTPATVSLLQTLHASVRAQSCLLDTLVARSDISEWLYTALIRSEDASLRSATADCVDLLCSEGDAKTRAFFLRQLLTFLDKVEEQDRAAHRANDVAQSAQAAQEPVPAAAAASGAPAQPIAADVAAVATSPPHASYEQYFELLQRLLVRCSQAGEQGDGYQPEQLLKQLLKQLFAHPILESEERPQQVDTAQCGLLNMATTVVGADLQLKQRVGTELGLVRRLFDECLFGQPESRLAAQIPKCKTAASRDAAFKLLANLAAHCPSNHEVLLDLMLTYLKEVPKPNKFGIDVTKTASADTSDNKQRFTGLKNQCSTCYMNSTLQQLFIIPQLRQNILNVRVVLPDEVAAKPESDPDRIAFMKGNVLHQLQTLFAYMQESKSTWVDTLDFCKAVRLMGAPIDVRRQEDANEFFNSLADQLEPFIKGEPEEKMFRHTFGGQLLHQIISQESDDRSERHEDYLTLSAKVQSKRNLKESMEFFVQGDLLDGNNKWKTEGGEMVAALKRCCILHLPNILCLHLRRFEFDLETFENVKIYDRFEFPLDVNMYPYTREGLCEQEGTPVDPTWRRPDDYYQYELTGVLMHSGTANSGHYYSYIRDPNPPAEGEAWRWYEFNDTRVTPWDPARIPDECFGGSSSSGYKKSHSAYMLFYTRRKKFMPDEYSCNPLNRSSKGVGFLGDGVTGSAGPVHKVEPAILDTIWKDSMRESARSWLLTKQCFAFTWDVLLTSPALTLPPGESRRVTSFAPVDEYRDLTPAEESSVEFRTIRLGTEFLMEVLSHCEDHMQMDKRLVTLGTLYAAHLPACKWLLDRLADPECNWMQKVLLLCTDGDIRTAAAELIFKVLARVAPHEHAFYHEMLPAAADDAATPESADAGKQAAPADPEKDDKGKGEAVSSSTEQEAAVPAGVPRATSVRFLYQMILLLRANADRSKAARIAQLLWLLKQYGTLGSPERCILLGQNAIVDLIALFDSHRSLGAWQSTTQNEDLVSLLSILACGCDNPAHRDFDGQPGVPPATGVELPAESLTKLFNKNFIASLQRVPAYLPSMLDLFRHWCFGNRETSATVIQQSLNGANTVYNPQARQVYLDSLACLLELEDKELQWRLDTILLGMVDLIDSNMRLEKFRSAFTYLLLDASEKKEYIRNWLITNGQLFELLRKNPDYLSWARRECLDRFVALFGEDAVAPPPPAPEVPPRTAAMEYGHVEEVLDEADDDIIYEDGAEMAEAGPEDVSDPDPDDLDSMDTFESDPSKLNGLD
mmetsp:Transcript_1676/g.5186  ORF Transcript_1676/g.5186 Transcript_1676/m.5186 type:complete len:1612 (+) Transcript_1676:2154-6989(+)